MSDCLFCRIAQGEIPSHKVYEDDYVLAFLDINPVTEYHTLVIPKHHAENIFDIPEDNLQHIMHGVKQVVRLYQEKLGIANIQIINNSGSEAQQEIMHIHFHLIPRRKGDNQDIIHHTHHPERREKFKEQLQALH